MAVQSNAAGEPRLPLTRERVLRAAVEITDARGIDSLTMRNLGHERRHVHTAEVVRGSVRRRLIRLRPP